VPARHRRLGLLELELVANVRPKLRAAQLTQVIVDVLRHADVIGEECTDDERVIEQVCEVVLLHAIRESRLTFMPTRKANEVDPNDDDE